MNDQEKLEVLRQRLQEINRGPDARGEKLAIFQAMEAERMVSMVLHKLNSLEISIVAELRAIRLKTQESSSQPQKPRKRRRWFSWKKKKAKRGEKINGR